MHAKIHIHIHVSDLNTSREFYQRFFGVGPVKQKNGYVKFLPEFAPINLADAKKPLVELAACI